VLEGLQPHPDIRSLEIENYQGDEFPPWLLMPILNNLVVLKLKGYEKCKKLPTAGHLSRLKILEIEGMDGVKIIGDEYYSGGRSGTDPIFPALERLSLVKMKSFVEWKVPQGGGGDAVVVLPCLEEFYIMGYPQLKSILVTIHLSPSKYLDLHEPHPVSLS
jgi:hypothetical protein